MKKPSELRPGYCMRLLASRIQFTLQPGDPVKMGIVYERVLWYVFAGSRGGACSRSTHALCSPLRNSTSEPFNSAMNCSAIFEGE